MNLKKMNTGPTIKRGRSKQDYATPEDFREAVRKRFLKGQNPNFDLAASASNFFSELGFWGEQENSLVRAWNFPGVLWLNPPFNNIEPWAAKCREEMEVRRATILFLTPASIGSVWFKNHVKDHAMVLALTPRLSFDGIAPYPKDCILSVFWAGVHGFDVWKWK